MKKVAVTGLGIISPLGCNMKTAFSRLLNGDSGITQLERPFDRIPIKTAALVNDSDFKPQDYNDKSVSFIIHYLHQSVAELPRYVKMAIAAADGAISDSGITEENTNFERVGVCVGTGIGGIDAICQTYDTLQKKGPGRISPFFVPNVLANSAAGHISKRYGFKVKD
jgi:3-oxoacyl-[acyl-carrier-protein] synthase II